MTSKLYLESYRGPSKAIETATKKHALKSTKLYKSYTQTDNDILVIRTEKIIR